MNELISVIIPMFNAENTIKRCVDSILKQKGKEFEIIIVDDGSKDNSLDICKKLEKQNRVIQVYHIDNKGVSHARNFGIEKANGKWIVFVDADDELADDVFFEVVNLQKKTSADLICWNVVSITEKGSFILDGFKISKNALNVNEIQDLKLALYEVPSKIGNFYGTMIRAVWGKLFIRDIIIKNKIKFPEGMIMGEDAAFLVEYLNYCKKVFFYDKPLYKYYKSNESVTGRYKVDYFNIQQKEADIIKGLCNTNMMDYEEVLVHFWNVAIMSYIENEFKLYNNSWKIIQKANDYLKKEEVKGFLMQKRNNSRASAIKSFLLKYNMTWLVAFTYVSIYKKRNSVRNKRYNTIKEPDDF